MTDLTPEGYEEVLEYLARAEREYEGRVMVRARCAPHFLRAVDRLHPDSPVMKGETSGCIAGTGYLRISPEGLVTPCPYMPADRTSPDLRKTPLKDIWTDSPLFRSLRDPKYNGKCGDCEYSEVCGGCRARALAVKGDVMGEDPWCGYEPQGKGRRKVKEAIQPAWTEEARERLEKVPSFLRPMVKKGVERYAASKGLREITPEIMSEMRKRAGR